jgi:hypothetical protein
LLAETTESIVAMVLWLSSTTTGTTTTPILLGLLLLSWGALTRAFSLPIIAVAKFGTCLVSAVFFYLQMFVINIAKQQ